VLKRATRASYANRARGITISSPVGSMVTQATSLRRKIEVSRGELYAELSANEDAATEYNNGWYPIVIVPSRPSRLPLKTLRRSTFKTLGWDKGEREDQSKTWNERFS